MDKYTDVCGASERKYMNNFQKHKDKFLSPFLKLLIKLKITPNSLSFASIVLGIGFIVFIQRDMLLSLILLIIAVFFDAIDGSLARVSGKLSLKGSLVDEFSDQVLIVMTTIGFLLINLIYGWVAVLYIFSYTTLIALIIIKNMKGIPYKWVFRPRLWVYLFFLIYVFWQINILNQAIVLFSVLIVLQILVGFFKIK